MKSSVLALPILFGLFFCASPEKNLLPEKVKVIQVDPLRATEEISLSSFASGLTLIPLETTGESFLGQVNEIKIRDNFIYVADRSQQSIVLFDLAGKFVNKLSNQGDGPDRYRQMGPFFLNESEDTIEIIDFASDNSRIISFSIPSFEFVKSEPIQIALSNSVRRQDGIYYYATQQIENTVNDSPTNGDILVIDESGRKKVLFDKNLPPGNTSFSPFTESFAYTGNDTLLVSLMYRDTVYRLEGEEAFPYLSFDFGAYLLDPETGGLAVREQLQILQNESEGKVSFPVLNASTPDLLAFSYYFKEGSYNQTFQYLDLKKRGRIFHTKRINNDLTDFPKEIVISSYFSGIRHEVVYKEDLVDIVIPEYELNGAKEIETKSLGKIQAEDNPIIILIQTKK